MESLLSDLRHAWRVFRKSPGFTAIAVAALALGIGAHTAIFSVINVILLKPLPFPESDRIMELMRGFPNGNGPSISVPKFTTWKKNDVFEAMAAYDFAGVSMSVGGGDHAEQTKAIHVTSEFFRVFGVSPSIGRAFSAEEDVPGGPRVVVISYHLFSRRLGADLRAVGPAGHDRGRACRGCGSPAGHFPVRPPADIFVPLQPDPNSTNQGHYLIWAPWRAAASPGCPAAPRPRTPTGSPSRRVARRAAGTGPGRWRLSPACMPCRRPPRFPGRSSRRGPRPPWQYRRRPCRGAWRAARRLRSRG